MKEGFASRSGPSFGYLGDAPSFVNFPTLYRWRVTAELIEEPKEVMAARLVELWETTVPNVHHTDAMRAYAKKFGAVLDPERRGIRIGRSG